MNYRMIVIGFLTTSCVGFSQHMGEGVANGMELRARQYAMSHAADVKPQAVNISCQNPVFIANSNNSSVTWLCANGGTKANISGTFFEIPYGAGAVAMANTPDNQLLVSDYANNWYKLSDTSSRGVADGVVEYAGMPYTEHLFPMSSTDIMSDDSFRGRLFRFKLSGNQATTTQSGSLPGFGRGITPLVFSQKLSKLFVINHDNDTVMVYPFNNGQVTGKPSVLYAGWRVNSLALDEETNTLFIAMVGDCNDQRMPVPGTNQTGVSSGGCSPSQILAMRLTPTNYVASISFRGGMLNMLPYNSGNPMAVVGGKLYVLSVKTTDPENYQQMILSYDFQLAFKTGAPTEAEIFADESILGPSSFIRSMIGFKGGPVVAVPTVN